MVINDYGTNNSVQYKGDQIQDLHVEIRGCNNNIYLDPSIIGKSLIISVSGDQCEIRLQNDIVIKEDLYITVEDNNCHVFIGDHTTFESTGIYCCDYNNRVEIGSDCMFALSTRILAGDSHSIIDLESNRRTNMAEKGVLIHNHVWIGTEAAILKDCEIFDDSIVAMKALITRDVPHNSIAGGAPAAIIKQNITWERERILPSALDTQKLALNSAEQSVRYNLEKITVSGNGRNIRGWCFVPNKSSFNSKMWVLLNLENGKQYQVGCQLAQRGDVAKAFGSNDYLNSGFNISFPGAIEQTPFASIQIVIKNADSFYKSELYKLN